jgi:hypothetical protein
MLKKQITKQQTELKNKIIPPTNSTTCPDQAGFGFCQGTKSTLKNQKACPAFLSGSYFFAIAPKKATFDNLMKPKIINGYRN